MRGLVLFLALAAASVAGSPVALSAQLSVEQLVVQLRPGDGETSILIPVRNEGSDAVLADVAMGDWRVDEEGMHSFHPAGTLADGCGDRLRPDAEAVWILPGGTAEVRLAYDGSASDRCRGIIFFRVTERPVHIEGDHLIISTGVKIYVQR
jgi:hypothetical protein